jgi:hypothetical protein
MSAAVKYLDEYDKWFSKKLPDKKENKDCSKTVIRIAAAIKKQEEQKQKTTN